VLEKRARSSELGITRILLAMSSVTLEGTGDIEKKKTEKIPYLYFS